MIYKKEVLKTGAGRKIDNLLNRDLRCFLMAG